MPLIAETGMAESETDMALIAGMKTLVKTEIEYLDYANSQELCD